MATIKIKAAPEGGARYVPLGRLPSVSLPSGLTPVGKALQGLGAAFMKAQATGLVAQAANYDVEYLKLQQDIEQHVRETARQTKESGVGYSEQVGQYFLERSKAFLDSVPEQLRPRYAKRLAQYQLGLEQRVYNFETKLHDEAVVRRVDDATRLAEHKVVANPGDAPVVERDLHGALKELPIPEPHKAILKRKVSERIQTAALRSAATGAYADVWLDRIHKVEGTGRNKFGTAAGHWQFTEGTWLSVVRRYAPKLASKLPRNAILALRNNYAFARQMARAHLNDLAINLMQNGLPVTGGNLRLSWFAGPGGAVKVLRADPSASVGSVLGDAVVNANPFLRGKSVGWLIGWANKQMKGSDPYPAVPTQTKLSLLRQANAQFAVAAAGDAATAQFQYAQTVDHIFTELKGLPQAEAAKRVESLIESGDLDRANGSLVLQNLSELWKGRWEAAKREAILSQDPQAVYDRLVKEGAPASVLNAVQQTISKRARGKLGELEALVALGDPGIADRIRGELVDPNSKLSKKTLKTLYKEALKNEQKLTDNLKEEWRTARFELAAKGQLSVADVEGLLGHPFVDDVFYRKLRAEAKRHEQVKAKLAEDEQKVQIEQSLQAVEAGISTPDAELDRLLSIGVANTFGLRKRLWSAAAQGRKRMEDQQALESLNRRLEAGLPLDPQVDKKYLDSWMQTTGGLEQIAAGNIDWVNENLVPFASRYKIIPPVAARAISGRIMSDDPEVWRTGVEMLTLIAQQSPVLIQRQFSDAVLKEWQAASVMFRYALDPKTVFDRVKAVREARARGGLAPMEKLAEESLGSIDLSSIVVKLGDGSFDPKVAAATNGPRLLADYKALYKSFFPYFNDDTQTTEAVTEALRRMWGVWDSKHNAPGSYWGIQTRFMLLPPTKVFPPGPDGTHAWLDKQLDQIKAKYKGASRIVLLADNRSVEEFRRREPPTYLGFVVYENGRVEPLPERVAPAAPLLSESAKAAMERERAKAEELGKLLGLPGGMYGPGIRLLDKLVGGGE